MKKLFFLLCATAALASCGVTRTSSLLDKAVYVDVETFKEQYKLGKAQWDAAFKFISNPSIDTLPLKIWNELDGGARARVTVAKTRHSGKFELHRKYVDVFYAVDGPIRIGVCSLDKLQDPKGEYKEKNDCIIYNKSTEPRYYIINKGQMIILFPTDGHSSNLSVGELSEARIAIVKVPYVSK